MIGGPIGGTIGVTTGTLSSISVGTGIGAGAYNNPLTLFSDMTWNFLGSAIGGLEVTANTVQNLFDPGTAVLNYETTRKNGTLCYDTNERSWSTAITGGRHGFGLGNVSHAWSEEALIRNGYSKYFAKWENQRLHHHESIHVGQQRIWGALATIDLGCEQLSTLFTNDSYPYFNVVLFGFEKYAKEHELDNELTDDIYFNFNRWRW